MEWCWLLLRIGNTAFLYIAVVLRHNTPTAGTAVAGCMPKARDMQFKPHEAKDGTRSWSLVRWTYDASKGRSCPKNLGSVTETQLRGARKPTQLLISGRLTEDERTELDEFWKAARPTVMAAAHWRALSFALYDVAGVVEAIEAGAATPDMADALWWRIDRLSLSLRKAGFRRPKPAKHKAVGRPDAALLPATL
jgi:hypothetical protein